MTIRLFNLDLHISVIADFKDICNRIFGSTVEITNWSISGHTWVFGETPAKVDVINQSKWKSISPPIIRTFQQRYDAFLSGFDGFIVTHTPVFSLLYEKYNKPIICINSCRYEQPYSWVSSMRLWSYLNTKLIQMHTRGQLIIVSNNKADQEYLRLGTGILSPHIPSLCLYTNMTTHTPTKQTALCYGNRDLFPHDDVLEKRPDHFEWSDLATYKAIVHVPYEISTMSIFEHLSAGIPLFFPTKDFYKECIRNGKMHLQSIYGSTFFYPPSLRPSFSNDFWLNRCDFYDETIAPFVYYYSSFKELCEMLQTFSETNEVKEKRAAWLQARQITILNAWKDIITRTFPSLQVV